MPDMELVLVHVGTDALPVHLQHAATLIQRISPLCAVTLLLNRVHIPSAKGWDDGLQVFAIEDLAPAEQHQRFAATSRLDRTFREGFWYRTTARFFVLADYMRAHGRRHVLHLENDVLPFFDPATKRNAFVDYAKLAVPLDRVRAIASMVWIADSETADCLAQHLLDFPAANDMEALNDFVQRNPHMARPLPTLPVAYARAKGLDTARFCSGVTEFGGVFDAAAIGQYVGGVDRKNNPHDSRLFINESSDLDLRECRLAWDVGHAIRQPTLSFAGETTAVLCLHAHAKDLAGVSPFNHGIAHRDESIITGERLQALADLTVGTAAITAFHGRENIRTNALAEIPQNANGQFLVPDEGLVRACQDATVLFVYTHLLEYFSLYLAPRLQRPFVLITHNSDHGVGLQHLDLLNHPHLQHWWAQNCETAHAKLSALPIGLPNVQWGTEKRAQLLAAARDIHKDCLLYVNVSPTHPSRALALQAALRIAGVTHETGLPYADYLAAMARHKFCLCPRGNGIDSHRFWEALYLGCIPVIVQADWTMAYSGLPILVLDQWDDLERVEWERVYQKLSATNYEFDRLQMAHYSSAISRMRRAAQSDAHRTSLHV